MPYRVEIKVRDRVLFVNQLTADTVDYVTDMDDANPFTTDRRDFLTYLGRVFSGSPFIPDWNSLRSDDEDEDDGHDTDMFDMNDVSAIIFHDA